MNNNIQLGLRKFVAPEYVFGLDARKLAATFCRKLGSRKVFLATDAKVASTAWMQELENSLTENNIDYVAYTKISPNPRDYEVAEGAEYYRTENCNLILTLGGGSVIDCGKAIGIIVTNQNSIKEYEGVDKISNPTPPIVCIPTTGGTSADVSQFAIINNTTERYKMAIISKALVPDVSLIDPMVLTSMDDYLTACTGMDALSHAFEAFVSNANAEFTDIYALEAIKLVNENLLTSIKSPNDIQARGKIMLASLYAGLAFSNASLGCVHSLAHSLGGFLDLAHGECNAILLPHVVSYNFNVAADRYKKIAQTMEIKTKGLTCNETKDKLIEHIRNLKSTININATLKEKGVNTDITMSLAKKAINDPCNATNPRAPKTDDLKTIYNEAL